MIVTPIVLILLLGTMLTGAFNGSTAIGDIRVLYKVNSTDSNLSAQWQAFAGQTEAFGIVMESADGHADGTEAVRTNRYAGYAEITDDGLRYYGSRRSMVESDIAQGVMAAFTGRFNLAAELAKDDPEQAAAIMAAAQSSDYVQDASLVANRLPSAMDYYAIAMITLIIMFYSMTASGLIDSERSRHTSIRLMAAPIAKSQIFTGKILGSLLQNAISVLIVMLVCKYMFDVYWGDNMALVYLVLVSQIVFAISLGLGFSYMVKGKAAGNLLMIFIQLAAFFGGSYFSLESVTGALRTLARFSPLEWTNSAILQIIYADNGAAAGHAMLLNIGFSIVFLGAAVLIMRKREGL